MKNRRLMAGAAVSTMLCAALLGGCGNSDTSTATNNTVEPGYWEAQETDDSIKGNDFIQVAASDNMELLLNPKTATIRWMDTETGAYQDTNLSADENYSAKDAQKADITVSYYNGTNSVLYKSYTSYDSFSMGSNRGQVGYQMLDNGVRVIYALGDDSYTYKNFPAYISDERMQEFVFQHQDAAAIENIGKTYYRQMSDGRWMRSSSKDSPLGRLAVKELTDIFYETGTYTEEELMADLQTWEIDPEEYPSNLMIRFAVDYCLDGDELVVSMDAGKIETGKDNPIREIEFLPYFLTSSTDPEADEEDGWMFIPDGSGSLMYLDSTKSSETRYIADFYGGDKLVGADTYSSTSPELMIPVIGMKKDDSTIMGVIEEGAEAAYLRAYVKGTDSSEPFNKIELAFEICPQQVIATDSGNAFSVYKASEDIYDEMISVRYFWLGEDADYVDMANTYREYLEENGELVAAESEEVAPLYVELLGVTDKTQYMLGFPYEGTQVMTSFSEAQEILADLNGAGIENIKMIYSGMLNGGMNQRALSGGTSFAPDLGGSSAFKKLVSYAESIGAEIYPNMLTQSAYTKKGLGGEKVAYNIVNARAQLYDFELIQKKVDETNDYPEFVVSPNYIVSYLEKAKSSFIKKTGLTTLASSDLMTYIGTNYRDVHVAPGTGMDIYTEALNNMADGMQLMLSNPISSAYASAAYLTDIPTEDSGARVLDASIPFVQLVLDGYKTYSTESLNLETTDIREGFMLAIETKSAPKFTFTYRDSALLEGTKQEDIFAVGYDYWKEQVGTYYAEYQEFYEAVKDAVIEEHELYEKNSDLRVVTYSNGVKVYLNYSDVDEKIDGVSVPAGSYIIEK